MELKFFHLVELNLEHPAIAASAIAKEVSGLSWITLSSKPFTTDKECIDQCVDFMRMKEKEYAAAGFTPNYVYSENPLLEEEPTDEDFDALAAGEECDFDDSTLIYTCLEDDTSWMIRGSVMVYGIDYDRARYN
jgi:hypothetical protein